MRIAEPSSHGWRCAGSQFDLTNWLILDHEEQPQRSHDVFSGQRQQCLNCGTASDNRHISLAAAATSTACPFTKHLALSMIIHQLPIIIQGLFNVTFPVFH